MGVGVNELRPLTPRDTTAVTFLNITDPAGSAISHVVDVNARKAGRFLAGSGQEIIEPSAVRQLRPEVIVLMNPVYREEICSAVRAFGLGPEFFGRLEKTVLGDPVWVADRAAAMTCALSSILGPNSSQGLRQPVAKFTLAGSGILFACALLQVTETVPADVLYRRDYPYFSLSSPALLEHSAEHVEALACRHELGPLSFVVEVASNDR